MRVRSWSPLLSALRLAVGSMRAWPLALWRCLPYRLRSSLWQPLPPTVHASPSVARMLTSQEDSELVRLATGGFNYKGALTVVVKP